MYIGLLPIDEGVIDVGIADEDTDGYIGHDRPFSAYCNLVSWPLHFAKSKTSRLTSERYHMCVSSVNAQSGSSFQVGFQQYATLHGKSHAWILNNYYGSLYLFRHDKAIGRKKEATHGCRVLAPTERVRLTFLQTA